MPFKSKAQRRKFAQLLVEGKIKPETYEEWNRETGGAMLPERVGPTKKAAKRKSTATKKATTRKRAASKRAPRKRAPAKKRAQKKRAPVSRSR